VADAYGVGGSADAVVAADVEAPAADAGAEAAAPTAADEAPAK
jgi:hypothetical protein